MQMFFVATFPGTEEPQARFYDAEIYRGGAQPLGPQSFQAWCTKCQPCLFQCGCGEFVNTKAFFDLAYQDCIL